MKQNILIVGGGIAGLTMAHEILNKNVSLTLIDSGQNYGSRVAAGQINPLVFRRMTKSWRLDEFLPAALLYYQELEDKVGIPIIVPSTIRRLFAHEQEKELWLKKQDLLEFQPYMDKLTIEDMEFDKALNTFGSGRVKQSFYVHSENFLSSALTVLRKQPNFHYIKDTFDYSELNPEKGEFQEKEYGKIIFCEGFQNKSNPWFNHIKIDPTKGQLLTVKSTEMYSAESLNRKCFVLPTDSSTFKVGSTYEWHNDTTNTTEDARIEIEEHLKSLVSESFEVIEQRAGIRPTTYDRRPILGTHPQFSKLAIFNGLGAKGYLIAPLLAKEFTDYLFESKSLDKEVELTRYYKS
jgi:glycine/D-amino acid oxidase-like deaminating enzyme